MDAFAIMGIEKNPWVDLERLKEIYLQKSTEIHPDKFQQPEKKQEQGDKLAELNQAYQILSNTRLRLRHLIESQGTELPHAQPLPEAHVDFFMQVGQEIKKVESFLLKRRAFETSIERAMVSAEGMDLLENLQILRVRLQDIYTQSEESLQFLGSNWSVDEELISTHAVISYAARFLEQINGLLLRLAE